MGSEFGDGVFEGGWKFHDFPGEGEFFGGFEGEIAVPLGIDLDLCLTEYGMDACDGIEEVGCGVAFEGEDFVPGEDVVGGSVLREVGIFEGAEADDPCNVFAGGFIEGWVFFSDDLVGAVDGFLEEVFEFDRVTGARFYGFAVFAEDGAEPGVS